MTGPTSPDADALRIPAELTGDARHLVAELAAVAGTEPAVCAALPDRMAELGTADALREFVAALVVTYAECLTPTTAADMAAGNLPSTTNTKEK